jgi:hypothetical protein
VSWNAVTSPVRATGGPLIGHRRIQIPDCESPENKRDAKCGFARNGFARKVGQARRARRDLRGGSVLGEPTRLPHSTCGPSVHPFHPLLTGRTMPRGAIQCTYSDCSKTFSTRSECLGAMNVVLLIHRSSPTAFDSARGSQGFLLPTLRQRVGQGASGRNLADKCQGSDAGKYVIVILRYILNRPRGDPGYGPSTKARSGQTFR